MAFLLLLIPIAVIGVGIGTQTLSVGVPGTSTTSIRHGVSGNLVAGVLVVSDTTVTANTRIFMSTHTRGTITLPAVYDAATRSAGVSFTITSSMITDTSTVEYLMIEP